jgi:hypothetical protein
MEFANIHEYYYKQKSIHGINPTFIIDFYNKEFKLFCKYDNNDFNIILSDKDIKHIDSDYLYLDVALLLVQKVNIEIDKYKIDYV